MDVFAKAPKVNIDTVENLSDDELRQFLNAAKMELARKQAADDFLAFCRFMRPDIEFPEDADHSAYQLTALVRLMGDTLTKVEKGQLLRVALSAPPQHGKSDIVSRLFPAWYIGRNPRKHVFAASYNQEMANSFGDDVRSIIRSQRFHLVFPGFRVAKGNASKDFIKTALGGKMSFVGVGGSGSGKPADLMIIDDSVKGDEDSLTPTALNKLWQWFMKVANARLRRFSACVILNTRWSTDDLIGRLTDPEHPDHDPVIAKLWVYLNIPAVVTSPKLADALGLQLKVQTDQMVVEQFGDKPMSALWEEEHDLFSLAVKRRMDKRSFDALYMGKPSPDEGDYFKSEWLVEYEPQDLPKYLRIYGASDHAVSMKQGRDRTVIGCVGVDANDDIWVLPDLSWEQMETPETVDALLMAMKLHKPMLWWMESELISKAFGPFLRKRMQEEKVYCVIDPQVPSNDKKIRARSIQGRMAMGKVHFPKFAPWWRDARHQLLTFPHASHDDFVDWLSWIGLGLTKELSASVPKPANENRPKSGTLAWVKAASAARLAQERARRASGGF